MKQAPLKAADTCTEIRQRVSRLILVQNVYLYLVFEAESWTHGTQVRCGANSRCLLCIKIGD